MVTGTVPFVGKDVRLWAGTGTGGPLVLYWHATASNAGEAQSGVGQAAITEVTGSAGVIASFTSTVGTGVDTSGNGVWSSGDLAVADEVVACAIQILQIDTRRIHSVGLSSGGLHTGAASYLRSGYLASVGMYSGGATVKSPVQDAAYVPDAFVAHGAVGVDTVGIDFANSSMDYGTSVKNRGGFVIDCNDGGGHGGTLRSSNAALLWQFLKDHPYGVTPEPYATLPSGYPTYCTIW
jgi:hypothetical protein